MGLVCIHTYPTEDSGGCIIVLTSLYTFGQRDC